MMTFPRRPIIPAGSLFIVLCALLFSSPLLAQKDTGSWHSQPNTHYKSSPWQEQHVSPQHLADKREDKQKGGDKKDRKRFESLTPDDREKLRERREIFKSLPAEERERIERAREKYRNLPPERREELKEKWRKMSPDERREYHRKMENDDRYRNYR